MPFRTRTWFLLSVMLFIAAAFFWRLGDERIAGRQASRNQLKQPPEATPRTPNPNPPRQSPFGSNFVNVTAQPIGLPAPAPADPHHPYRLRNTADSVNQLARNDKAILLRNALIDTTRDPLVIPTNLRAG